MKRNPLSKDLLSVINQLKKIEKKHHLELTEDDWPTSFSKALDLLNKAYIEALVDEEVT